MAESNSYVLVVDIADFYNQIYLHRLRNAIESCDDTLTPHSKVIEEFLLKLNSRVSKGIPVGAIASIVLAEALLIDVDEFIWERNRSFCRYVDDFRIFSDSKIELSSLLDELTNYLYHNHRLPISSAKTKILRTDEFVNSRLDNPQVVEAQKIHEELNRISGEGQKKVLLMSADIYSVNQILDSQPKAPSSSDTFVAEARAFQELMNQIIERSSLNLGLARHIIRRSKKVRSRAILMQLLRNFDFFVPAINDVVLYFHAVVRNEATIRHYLAEFNDIVENCSSLHLPVVRYWLRYYFAQHRAFAESETIVEFMKDNTDIRNQALYAKTHFKAHWVRNLKGNIDNLSPWERRAVIFASSALSNDERRVWMNSLASSESLVDRSLARYMGGARSPC